MTWTRPAPTQPCRTRRTWRSVGEYCWRGVFTSATKGVPDSTDASAGECFEVLPVTPDLSTTAGPNVEARRSGDGHGRPRRHGPPAGRPGDQWTRTATPPVARSRSPSTTTPARPSRPASRASACSGDRSTAYTASYTPTAAGTYHWAAVYSGDPPNTNGTDHNADCLGRRRDRVKVVDAQIDVSPLTATNEVNDAHTITATVQQDAGSGWEAAPDGTVVTFSLLNNTAGADVRRRRRTPAPSITGSAPARWTSTPAPPAPSTSTPRRPSRVAGVSLTRETGTGRATTAPNANKVYVDAYIVV